MSAVTDLLGEIRDLLAHRGRNDKPGMPTADRGIETPLVMATIQKPGEKDFNGAGPDFVSYARFETHHYTSGEVFVMVAERRPAAVAIYAAQVRVVGWVGSQANVLATMLVNSASGAMVVPLKPDGDTYDQITIAVRQWVNLGPSSVRFPDGELKVQHETRLSR